MLRIRRDSLAPLGFHGLEIHDYGDAGSSLASFARITVPPGGCHPRARSRVSDKYYICLLGSVTFMVEKEEVVLEEGDLLVIHRGEWFSYRVEHNGDRPTNLLLIHIQAFNTLANQDELIMLVINRKIPRQADGGALHT